MFTCSLKRLSERLQVQSQSREVGEGSGLSGGQGHTSLRTAALRAFPLLPLSLSLPVPSRSKYWHDQRNCEPERCQGHWMVPLRTTSSHDLNMSCIIWGCISASFMKHFSAQNRQFIIGRLPKKIVFLDSCPQPLTPPHPLSGHLGLSLSIFVEEVGFYGQKYTFWEV